MILRKGLNDNGVRVMSEEALRYALTPIMGPDNFEDIDEKLRFIGAYFINGNGNASNLTGGTSIADNIFDPLVKVVHQWGGYFGTNFALDLETGDYVVLATNQCPGAIGGFEKTNVNRAAALKMTNGQIQTELKKIVNETATLGCVALRGNIKNKTETFMYAGQMFKDSKKIPKKNDYYRFDSQTKILGRLAFSIALEERIVKFNEPVKNYIPQFYKNNLSVYSKENKFLLNIIDIASSLPDFSILVDNIVKSGLVDPIKNNLELTVFAPTNEAFGKNIF